MNKLIAILLLLPSIAFAEGNYYSGSQNFVQDANCVAAYYMNVNADDETDRSGEGETLTETGSIPTSSTVPTNYSGTSRDFEASDDPHDFLVHADGGSTDLGASDLLSIVAWARFETVGGNDQAIVAKGAYAGTDGSYVLRYESSNGFFYGSLTSNATPTWTEVSNDTAAEAATWYHVALVYNKTDIRLYVNGVLEDTQAYTADIFGNTGSFRIGSYGGSGHLDGLLDEVAVFSRALSEFEIISIYQNGLTGGRGSND